MKSIEYWENRYKNNGNSGSGSRNKLQEFKSEIINNILYKISAYRVYVHFCEDNYSSQK